MSYYNERNGWVDNGKPLNAKNTRCPNCKRDTYVESLSREYCSSCGMECNYWGGGSNEVYDQMMKRDWAEEEELKRQLREEWGDDYDF